MFCLLLLFDVFSSESLDNCSHYRILSVRLLFVCFCFSCDFSKFNVIFSCFNQVRLVKQTVLRCWVCLLKKWLSLDGNLLRKMKDLAGPLKTITRAVMDLHRLILIIPIQVSYCFCLLFVFLPLVFK